MTAPRSMRRGKRRGQNSERMPSYLREDLLRHYAGEKKDAHGWAIVGIWYWEKHLLEAYRLWREFAAENPSVKMPELLAKRLVEKHVVYQADHPDAPLTDDHADVVAAAGLTVAEVEARVAAERER